MSTAGLPAQVLILGVLTLWALALVPSALITALKSRWLLFALGFPLLGLIWFIGALAVAPPDSWWAQRFYGERMMARATDPESNPPSRRRTLAWLGGVLGLLLVVGLFASRPTPVLGVDGESLQYSVGGPSLFGQSAPCRHVAPGTWSCSRYDSSRSADVGYRVRIHGLGCWTATRIGSRRDPGEQRLSGCITLADQLRLLDQLR